MGSVLLIVLAAAVFFIRHQVHASFPDTEGSLTVRGITAPVRIVRDEFGVPTITAESEQDLAFAQGFVHAQDRLWQMDMQRRIASGRLSELFGGETVPFDRMFRIVGLRRAAERIAESLPSETRRGLEAYAAGVNAFLERGRRYPIEFDLLRYDPEPWTSTDCLLVGRLLAWELNLAWWTDLTMGAIGEKVSLQELLDIIPSSAAGLAPGGLPGGVEGKFGPITEGMRRAGETFLRFSGARSFGTGSNAWVVGPSRSSTGGVLLANDTHLQLTLPPQWYEVQLRCPGYDAGGMSVPGAPWVIAGRNDSIAWGITNLMADDADFYVEQLDSTGTRALFDGAWVPLRTRIEEIAVRGDTAVPLTVRETMHGPIVTDVSTSLQHARPPYVASMRWTGADVDDQFDAFFRISRARNWHEFSEGVRRFAVPGQNFLYGDVRGNIGYRCGARIPLRGKLSPMLPLPGWEKSAVWKGYVPFEELPWRYNPREGFIASANNAVAGTPPRYISDLWEPSSRYDHLREVLGRGGEVFSVQDFQRLQNDTYSAAAREIVPFIFAAFNDSVRIDDADRALLEYLRNWNFYFTRDDIATSIFQMFFVRLLENTYRDEMGDALFHDWVILVNVPIRVTERLLHDGTSAWFDDRTTPDRVEVRDEIIRASLREAGEDLARRRGPEKREWQWGTLHTVTLSHPFGMRKPLDRIFNQGPFPVGGGSTSLTSFEYSFNEPFAATVGPSFRQVFDLASSSELRAVLPAGQSGQLFHPHYDDQTRLWLNGGYRIERRDGGSLHQEVLVLEAQR